LPFDILKTTELFSILDSVDSTNNYAMAKVHAGMARHGMAWFAQEQTSGRGQPGKNWQSQPGQNILLSIAIEPPGVFSQRQFYFNAAIALACHDFFKKYAGEEITVKWPNDIYWRDRKAGGILIENKLMGKSWKWAVVGIGININELMFGKSVLNAVSLSQITGRNYDTVVLARELHELILTILNEVSASSFPLILSRYNEHLFKKDQVVKLRKGNMGFETRIKAVNEFGQLITEDSVERVFNFGEVEWML
jgi:BirA family biotin operon repressor/biotin-[acetyl-CoA-carboxylase] ligase